MSVKRPLITLPQGNYLGLNLHPLQQWLNIPYALPPIGNRRFRPPIPIPSLPEGEDKPIIDASEWGCECPGSMNLDVSGEDGSNYSEDCLNLNVFRPMDYFSSPLNKSENGEDANRRPLLPVLLYIHGGGFNGGSARGRNISNLVASAYSPMIGVSFNYRVGAFGFLSGPLAAAEGENGGVNVGLKDQRCAMEWVHENIEAFGGDPNNVTLMGTSAGAHSIGHHLNNPPSPPLFHRLILESGSSTSRACHPATHPLHVQQFQDFISIVGAPTTIQAPELLNHLRTLPMETIHAASAAVFGKYHASSIRWPWQPVIEGQCKGSIIPRRPIESLKSISRTTSSKIPILTGFNSNEGSMFILPFNISTSQKCRAFWTTLRQDFTYQDHHLLETLYPDPDTDSHSPFLDPSRGIPPQSARLEAAYSDYAYIAPVQQTAFYTSISESPSSSSSTSPSTLDSNPNPSTSSKTYLYEFALAASPSAGVDHGDHSAFITRDPEVALFSPTWNQISEVMCRCWVGFITGGDPNLGLASLGNGAEWGRGLRWDAVGDGGEGFGRMVFGEGNREGEGWKGVDGGQGGKEGDKGVTARFEKGVREVGRRDFWWGRS